MIGRFGDKVIHVPTNQQGEVTMPLSGMAIGICSTPVRLEDGSVKEFQDCELRYANQKDEQ